MAIKFFKIPESMVRIPCEVCNLPDCDVLIQDDVFGGNFIVLHDDCLQALETNQDDDDEEE